MRLNLGSGKYPLKGWKNIDIDSECKPDESYDISGGIKEEANSVDEILISHFLMYFGYLGVWSLLEDCYRVLKPGGLIRITEDNAQVKVRNEKLQEQYGDGVLFTRIEMEDNLKKTGFAQIKEGEPFKEVMHHLDSPQNYPLATGRASVYFLSAIKPVTKEKGTIVYLGLDEFGEKNSSMDLLWRLRDYFDNFRVNLFAIPNNNLRDFWSHYIHKLEWIRLCLHGYHHIHNEELDEIVLRALTPGQFARVYKPPFWELSDEMYNRLGKMGFKILLHPNDPREGIKFNWEIDREIPKVDVIHAYGHIYPHDYLSEAGNKGSSLFHFWENIMKLPKNTDFRFY